MDATQSVAEAEDLMQEDARAYGGEDWRCYISFGHFQ